MLANPISRGTRAREAVWDAPFPAAAVRALTRETGYALGAGEGIIEFVMGEIWWPRRKRRSFAIHFGRYHGHRDFRIEPPEPLRVALPAGTWPVVVSTSGRGPNEAAITVHDGLVTRAVIDARLLVGFNATGTVHPVDSIA